MRSDAELHPVARQRFEAYPHQGAMLVKKLDPRATIPTRGYGGSAGWDLTVVEDVAMPAFDPHTWLRTGLVTVATGLAIKAPDGYFSLIIPRSSSRARGWHVQLGTLDGGYTGEASYGAVNLAGHPVVLRAGERIAQLILLPVFAPAWVEVDSLPETERGSAGWGSTGRGSER